MQNQKSVETHPLHLAVEATVQEHHTDLGVGRPAKECRFCRDQTPLVVVEVVEEVDHFEAHSSSSIVMGTAGAPEAVAEQAVVHQVLAAELVASSRTVALQRPGVLLRKCLIEKTGALADWISPAIDVSDFGCLKRNRFQTWGYLHP